MRKDTQMIKLGRLMALLLGLACAAAARADGTEAYTGNLAYAEAVADFNGDGMPDVAVVNMYDDNVSVLMSTTASGSTSLSFADQQPFYTGYGPQAVSAADLNGDGKPDLIVGNCSDNTVAVFMNTTVQGSTTASFADPVELQGANGPCAMTVVDVNGDGLPDIVTADLGDNAVAVFLNTTPQGASVPSFAAAQSFAVGSSPWSIVAADINGDGKLDIAVVNLDDSTMSVLINTTAAGDTTPSFLSQQVFPGGNGPQAIAAGDLNGDGKPDMAVAGYGDTLAYVLINTTVTGSSIASFATAQTFDYGSSTYSVSIADVNGDGTPDIVIADAATGGAYVWVNSTPTGSSSVSVVDGQELNPHDGGWAIAVTTADMNGDGMPEILLVNAGNGEVNVLLNATAPGDTNLSFLP